MTRGNGFSTLSTKGAVAQPRAGFTLVELLVGMAIMAILGGIQSAILSAGFESWSHSQGQLEMQQVANELMEMLLEGGFDGEGIKDAVELRDATLSAVTIVPLWTDRTHEPDPLRNKAQLFTLEKQFRPGASTPVGQSRRRGSEEWVSVPITFTYGEGRDPSHPDDVVTFTDPIPDGASLRILYTPDPEAHPETQMRFSWNPTDGQVYRSYAGVTQPLSKRMHGVRVERLAFLYYDNLNRLLPLNQAYSEAELRRITGVKLYLMLRRGHQWQELTSFTNVRNVATTGVTIAKGSVLPLPTPKEIKAFSLGDFSALTGPAVVELVVKTQNRPRWLIRLEFTPAPREDRVILHRFQMEGPPGTIRASDIVDRTMARVEFVNLLTIDQSGLYDYDDEPDVKGVVQVTGDHPVLEVTQCDFKVASLFIRP